MEDKDVRKASRFNQAPAPTSGNGEATKPWVDPGNRLHGFAGSPPAGHGSQVFSPFPSIHPPYFFPFGSAFPGFCRSKTG